MSVFFGPDDTTLYADGILREEPIISSNITKQRVDVGAQITNHIEALPDEWVILALWTDTPLRNRPATTSGVLAGYADNAHLRPQAALEWFQSLRGAGLFSYVSDRFGFIENLGLERISTTRTNRGDLRLEIRFRVIEFAESEIADLPPRRVKPVPAKPGQDKGEQPGKVLDPDVGFASWAAGSFDFFNFEAGDG